MNLQVHTEYQSTMEPGAWLFEVLSWAMVLAMGESFETVGTLAIETHSTVLVTQPEVVRMRLKSACLSNARQPQTHNLRRTRDLLLPRMLSGQVEVG